MNGHYWLVAALLALVWTPSIARAVDPSDDFAPETMLFDEVPTVISATRTEQSLLDVPSSVTVITSDEIRASGATSLVELLETVPGLDVMRISRSDVNISARGFNAPTNSNLLVMVDGRSVYLDFFGTISWDRVNVALTEIDKIEVVRGPSSAFYGANAFLGTINIVTKRARDLKRAQVWSGVGPDGGFVETTTAYSAGDTAIKGSASYDTRKHFRNETLPPNADHRRDDNGLRARRFRGSIEHEFESGAELRVSGGMARLKGDLFSTVGTWDYEGPEYFVQVNLDQGSWRFQTFATRVDLDPYTIPSGLPVTGVPISDRITSNTFDVELQRELHVDRHDLLIGFNTRVISTDAPDILGSRESETLYAAFFQDQFRINDWMTMFAAARLDEHPKAGLNVSPKVSLLFKPSETSRMWVGYSRAFRAPTQVLNYLDLTLSGFTPAPTPLATLSGNEDLDPSWATSYEGGFQVFPHPKLNVQGALFYQVIEDQTEVVTTALGPPTAQTFRNAGRVSLYGLESQLEFKHSDRLRGFAGYTFQEAHGPDELATPRHKLSAGLRGQIGSRVRYSLTGLYVDHTEYEDADATLADYDIPSRFQVDTFLGVQVVPQFELGLRARNVFHQVRRQFPVGDEIGSEVMVTGRLEF